MAIISFETLIFAQDLSVEIFLDSYFNQQTYSTMSYDVAGERIICANNEKDNDIFDRAIIFTIENEKSIRPLFYIQKESLFNSSDLIFTGRIKSQLFYGWKMNFSEKNSSFSLDFYTDNGNHVTDGPIFMWDKSKMKFNEYIIDKTML